MSLIEFFFPKERIVTIDIGSQYIKGAQFYLSGKNPVMTHFEILPTPPGSFEKGVLTDDNRVDVILSEMLKKKMKINSLTKLLVSIQGSNIFTRVLQTPNYKGDMLKEYIRFQGGQYIPYDLSEVSYSYEELHCFKKSKSNKNFIFVAVNKDHLEDYASLFINSGFRIHKIRPSFFCLEETFGKNNPKKKNLSDENTLILDIGYQTSGFHILKENQSIFSRYFVTGLEFYLEEIQNQLGVTLKEAQSLLKSVCTEKNIPNKVEKVIQNYHSIFCREICMGLEYFANYFPEAHVHKGFLTGGGAHLVGLRKELSQRMEVNIEVLPVFRNTQTKGFSRKKLEEIHNFAGVCVGLALGHVHRK